MLRFFINGVPADVQEQDSRTLLEYIRNVSCLKGTKEGCGTGHCGACSVLIDGALRRSCVTMVRTLNGKCVETIEHIAQDGTLDIIQRSFLDAGAVQCGFCTPGMVLATKALLSSHPDPTEEEILEGLKQNYCRCTGYVKILEAVRLAAARLRGEAPTLEAVRTQEHTSIVRGTDQDLPLIAGRAVGQSVWDVDGPAKVRGALKFCDDFESDEFGEAEMLHGAFVWAPAPKATIHHVDWNRKR